VGEVEVGVVELEVAEAKALVEHPMLLCHWLQMEAAVCLPPVAWF